MIGYSCLILYWVSIGFGKDESQAKRPMSTLVEASIIQRILYLIGLALAKTSVLLFYHRVFGSISRRFQVSLSFTAFAVLALPVVTISLIVFGCTPLRRVWNPTVPGHCLDTHAEEVGVTISDVVIDLVLLLMPLPMLWRLQVSKAKRVHLIVVFVIGYWCV